MIGIVIVSHSAKLAEGIEELARQMTQGQVPLAAAGGIDDPDHPIGTDAMRIYQAIESVYSDDGVLVLMDMGSALLSAETALEFLSDDQRSHIHLTSAPIMEGTMAAAVQAMVGADIEQVMQEARTALSAKATQLGDDWPEAGPQLTETSPTAREIILTIHNLHGLHARPAAQFVSTAARFKAHVTVRNVTQSVGPINAKSINQIATLGARQGHQIGIAADGLDADDALAALESLVIDNFGESETAPETSSQPDQMPVAPVIDGELAGIPVSPGVAIGPVAVYRLADIEVETITVDDPHAEWLRLQAALKQARAEIHTLHNQALAYTGSYEAAIFEAHLLFLDDPALVDDTLLRLKTQKINAEAAWQATIRAMMDTYRHLDDPYMQARAADVADVGQRVLRVLTGTVPPVVELTEPSILVATDLTPSDTAQLDPRMVLAICTELGSATSHSAILARAMGIPAVLGLGGAIAALTPGMQVGVDGQRGRIWLEPDDAQIANLQARRQAWLDEQLAARAFSHTPGQTRDGKLVEVVANIGGPQDVKAALDAGAEGVGLFRTEFLYLERTIAPTEAEQVAIYRQLGEAMGDRPIVFRTLDIGGDKPLPYMHVPAEENPFLGWRGIRLMLDKTDMFKTQLRAILKASPGHNFKIMFPMVSIVAEIQAARALLAEVQAELRQAGIPFDDTIEVGIMIEVPSAVAVADQLAAEVDFFSIGTNDLSQYTMAADRTNPYVAALPNAFQPAVLRLIRQTINAAHEAGIWVGLCGEFAGHQLAMPILLGLGLDEFSMSAPSIPLIKQALSKLTIAEAQSIAAEALTLTSADAVQAYVAARLEQLAE
jgi:phosphocarrier protein FPr